MDEMSVTEQLKQIAERLIWWQPAEESVNDLRRLVAQVMNRGSWEDVKFVQQHFGVAAFRDALDHAEPGWFERDSWTVWHNAFELPVPALPRPAALAGTAPLNWRGR